ncbi:hypothetical protein KJ633_06510 [bacterium]|nr:acetyl-CoA carboxylase biotin carboxyl carrier protein subunit [bacterium]MBU3956098.1 hypothetical protein [bacterium]MBU4134730.1 hypothetical protein [bacterium]
MKKNTGNFQNLQPESPRSSVTPKKANDDLDFKEIMEVLGATDVCEFEYSKGDMHIVIKKEPVSIMLGEIEPEAILGNTAKAESAPGLKVRHGEREEQVDTHSCIETIKSPAVGTFYISDGDILLSSVGEKIKKGRKIGWVNSMGIRQDIIADKNAEITAILCKDREVVEWGQTLFEIKEENV